MEQFKTVKFLEEAKRLALTHMDDAVPIRREDLYPAKMWVMGVIDALIADGYEIKKKDKK